ncbi:DUF2946 domain-containing protein [Ralstonia pseudosolanacearum]|nr:DUF2946 domain-containing protein [Ralstonia pseudosolanacearum]AOE91852.1 hypothetical protein LBM341_03601 [Ralstonia solanacearum]APF90257.1 hypothetical protein BCR16_20085 [Ralstonia solanacearum FJAT-1458]ARS58792.1 hypothetical protein BC427_21930 [Ralstonia solanacearum FJAT-91]AVV67702.1 DUF2946 domain-containing protein [Ralstonia solanacearum OE1-1]ESS51348.1 hypothetical protein L665_00082 [Ralstonia solanacearum SD54]
MFPRRWFFLVWLAIVLNVLSPVLASARAAQSGTLAVDLCSATAPHGSTVRISIDLRDEGAPSPAADHHGVAHCLYCPGFAAGFALASPPAPGVPTARFAYRVRQPAAPLPVHARNALRVAESRAPPRSPMPLSS